MLGLPGWLSGKEPDCNVGDAGSVPGSGRSPGVGNGKPLQYSYLENPMDRGAWWAIQSMRLQRAGYNRRTLSLESPVNGSA